jgi:hypothetical protein
MRLSLEDKKIEIECGGQQNSDKDKVEESEI